jgi:hypothetical protein
LVPNTGLPSFTTGPDLASAVAEEACGEGFSLFSISFFFPPQPAFTALA